MLAYWHCSSPDAVERRVLLPMVIVLPVLRSTGDWDATLAGFLAIGITVLGALACSRRWWPPYLLLAAAVALMLLLAPDGYTAFGITLDVVWAPKRQTSPTKVFTPVDLHAAGGWQPPPPAGQR